eukprot:4120564-Prymnesium_polylepis.1
MPSLANDVPEYWHVLSHPPSLRPRPSAGWLAAAASAATAAGGARQLAASASRPPSSTAVLRPGTSRSEKTRLWTNATRAWRRVAARRLLLSPRGWRARATAIGASSSAAMLVAHTARAYAKKKSSPPSTTHSGRTQPMSRPSVLSNSRTAGGHSRRSLASSARTCAWFTMSTHVEPHRRAAAASRAAAHTKAASAPRAPTPSRLS